MKSRIKYSYIAEGVVFIGAIAVVFALKFFNCDIGEGGAKIAYDVSINLMAASVLAFTFEFLGDKMIMNKDVRCERDRIFRVDALVRPALQRFSLLYIQLSCADFNKVKSICDNAIRSGNIIEGMPEAFAISEMVNVFMPSMFIGGSFQRPVVEEFFEQEHRIVDEFSTALRMNEFTHFTEIKQIMADFIDCCSTILCEKAIVDATRMTAGKEKLSEMMTKWLKDGTVQGFYNDVMSGKRELAGNLISDYVRLYEKIKKERAILVRYDNAIQELRREKKENENTRE